MDRKVQYFINVISPKIDPYIHTNLINTPGLFCKILQALSKIYKNAKIQG